MKINWKLRLQSPQFWLGLVGVIVSPILTYMGLTNADLTSWQSIVDLGTNFISNPYLIGVVITSVLSFVGIATDPTTKGMCDSDEALCYNKRKDSKTDLSDADDSSQQKTQEKL